MTVISVPKILRQKLGEDGAEALVELLNRLQENQKISILQFVEEKFERRLTEEISALREEIAQNSAALREEIAQNSAALREEIAQNNAALREEIAQNSATLRGEIAQSNASLREEIASVQANMIKWMFIFWIGQVGVILGILFAFFK